MERDFVLVLTGKAGRTHFSGDCGELFLMKYLVAKGGLHILADLSL